MADGSTIEIPADLLQVAQEKGISEDLVRRALALGFPADAVKQQMSMPNVDPVAAEAFIAEQERIRAGGEITIPPELLEVAQKNKWPEELVKRAIKLGASTEMLINQISAGIPAEQAERFIAQQEAIQSGGIESTLDLSWMKVPTEWGIRVRPGKKGLTVGMLNVGTYADIPDYWPYQTEMPRGAHPLAGVAPMGYSIYEKAELWSDNSADLYEEAIQRRWRPSTDIPWETIEELPEEIERAMCQLCTVLCEKALLAGDIVGRWLPEMSYGYHEVKLFIAATAYDHARQFDVFRKRAHSNGGGMGLQTPGYLHRAVLDARAWTETSVDMHIFWNSHLMGLLQIGSVVAHNEAESKIFHLMMQDVARQIAYGVQHLRYFLTRHNDRRKEVHQYLNKIEAVFVHEMKTDTPLREALIILLGGGMSKEQIREGTSRLEYFNRRWIRDYLRRLAAASVTDRGERINRELRDYVQVPEEAGAAA
jgi:hypothetical protein